MPDPADPYGLAAAGSYDDLYTGILDTEATVARLLALAGGGPALEFGVGTGRLALPLAERGLAVSGIERSSAMLDELRRKRGAERIEVTEGDFAEARVQGRFSIVFVAFNAIFALTTPEDQGRCFRNAFRHLRPGGDFVVEAMVFDPDESGLCGVRPRHLGARRVELEAFRYDPPTKRLETTLVHIGGEGIHLIPANHCYASPGEMDAMARDSGFEPRSRWEDWNEAAFVETSEAHVSVYARPV